MKSQIEQLSASFCSLGTDGSFFVICGFDITGKKIGIDDAVVIRSKNISIFDIFIIHKNQ
jgi:hypothetical protein